MTLVWPIIWEEKISLPSLRIDPKKKKKKKMHEHEHIMPWPLPYAKGGSRYVYFVQARSTLGHRQSLA